MMSELRCLLVAGGASHTWVVVADEQAVCAHERLPALNRVGAPDGVQRSPMKLIRIGARSVEHPALLGEDGTVLDLSGLTADIDGAFLVIGRTARYLDTPASALDQVAGYAMRNDVSEREFQLERSNHWDLGKSEA